MRAGGVLCALKAFSEGPGEALARRCGEQRLNVMIEAARVAEGGFDDRKETLAYFNVPASRCCNVDATDALETGARVFIFLCGHVAGERKRFHPHARD